MKKRLPSYDKAKAKISCATNKRNESQKFKNKQNKQIKCNYKSQKDIHNISKINLNIENGISKENYLKENLKENIKNNLKSKILPLIHLFLYEKKFRTSITKLNEKNKNKCYIIDQSSLEKYKNFYEYQELKRYINNIYFIIILDQSSLVIL